MVDSVLSRILCEKCGIFGLRDQETMHRILDSFVRHGGMEAEPAVDFMVGRWEEYERAAPQLRWTYGSAYRFFLSGQWNKPDMWPWTQQQSGPDPNVGVYRSDKRVM
jgi:hypothetical protein